MIIRIDHIGVVCSKSDKKEVLAEKEYEFAEIGIKNISEKRKLMNRWQETHDIYYEKGVSFPKEYIFYENTCENTRNEMSQNVLYAFYNDKNVILKALEMTPFFSSEKVDENDIWGTIGGVLDSERLRICLKYSDDPRIYLDSRGINNIALICSKPFVGNIEGFHQTEYQKLNVNGNNLSISFLYSENISLMFEMICPEVKNG